MNNPEKTNFDPERNKHPEALEQLGAEQREVLREKLERGEQSHESLEDDARHEALKKAVSSERERKVEVVAHSSTERHHDTLINQREREASFRTTMKEVQTHMSTPSRTFSKLIHNKTVEKASDLAASTVARPNAILAGAISAFFLTLGVYLVAKNLGYPLSGFETIGAFILGWVIGIAYDFLKVMITGRK